MAFEHKPGSFSLFKNDKAGNEARPDYRGEGKDLTGNAIEVAAWLKDGGNGKFMSCRFKLKGERPQQVPKPEPKPTAKLPGGLEQMDDDIPFAPIGRGISGHAI
jgi:hypothetical protein